MTAMWVVLGVVLATLVAAWLDVFVIGGGVRIVIRYAPQIRAPGFRFRYNHWLPKLVRAIRFGLSDRRNYYVVAGNTIHASGYEIKVGSLGHEVYHLVREEAVGIYHHFFRHLFDRAWAAKEEAAADAAKELWVRDGTSERRSLDSIAQTINAHGAAKAAG